MASAADGRRSRHPLNRRPGRRADGPRGNEKSLLPSPVRIHWHRTRVLAKERGDGRLKSWTPVVALPKPSVPRKAITNDVPVGRPGRDVVEAAVRQAVSRLDGRWRARIAPIDAYCVELESPDGFRCLAFIPNPERQDGRSVARRLRDACRRPPAPTRWRRAWVLVMEEP